MGDTHCPVCGHPLEIHYQVYDDENNVAGFVSHCQSCGSDWEQLVYYSGCRITGRTEIDRTPLHPKYWD